MERRNDDWLTLLRALVDAGAAAESSQGTENAFRLLLEALGHDAHWHRGLRYPALEVEHGFGGALIIGHVDAHRPLSGRAPTPFEFEGEFVRGPGVRDMNAGLVTIVQALKDLPDHVPFRLLIISDESLGGTESKSLVVSRAKEAPLALVAEPGGDDGALVVARAGTGRYTLDIERTLSDQESGDSSPLIELSRQVLWLAQLRQRALGTTVEVLHLQGDAESLRGPSAAHAEVKAEAWTPAEMDRISEALTAPPIYDRCLRVEYQGGWRRPPMNLSPDASVWWQKASTLWQDITGKALIGVRSNEGSPANYVASWAPTLDGLGPWGSTLENEGEIWWPSIQYRAELIRRLLTLAAAV